MKEPGVDEWCIFSDVPHLFTAIVSVRWLSMSALFFAQPHYFFATAKSRLVMCGSPLSRRQSPLEFEAAAAQGATIGRWVEKGNNRTVPLAASSLAELKKRTHVKFLDPAAS